MSRIYIGACSWSDFSSFYPAGLPAPQQIAYYSQRFPLVEVNSTYYRIFPPRNFSLWAERTPPGFVFDVKAFRQLTFHDRETPPTPEVDAEFSASVQPLRDAGKLGALHFQFAPWFTYSEGNLDYLASLRERYPQDKVSVEFRHRSWYGEEPYQVLVEALKQNALSLTVVDEPQVGSGSVPTVADVVNPNLVIVRFHGRNDKNWYARNAKPAQRFDYLYSDEELAEWVPNVAHLADLADSIHILFNNNFNDYAIENTRTLRTMLRQKLPAAEVVAAPEE